MRVRTEYRKIGYTIADAFRRDPKHGKRIFYVETEDLGTEDMEAITEAARQTAPPGYELFECKAI